MRKYWFWAHYGISRPLDEMHFFILFPNKEVCLSLFTDVKAQLLIKSFLFVEGKNAVWCWHVKLKGPHECAESNSKKADLDSQNNQTFSGDFPIDIERVQDWACPWQ